MRTRWNDSQESGFLIIDKPVGMTSRMVDNAVGKIFHTRSIGHLGTLDPFASGMLVIAVNKANKCLPFVEDGEKTYIARLKLFEKTETGDPESPVVEIAPKRKLDAKEVDNALRSFLGKSFQVPPMTSAIKVEGEALYKKARRGEEVERKPREIEILSIKLCALEEEAIVFSCRVSKGTYIRVLGADIAKKLGTIGYLTDLRRTSIGNLEEKDMNSFDFIAEAKLFSPALLIDMPKIEATPEQEKLIRNGMKMRIPNITGDSVLFLFPDQSPLGVYERENGDLFRCKRGLF